MPPQHGKKSTGNSATIIIVTVNRPQAKRHHGTMTGDWTSVRPRNIMATGRYVIRAVDVANVRVSRQQMMRAGG